MRGRHSFGHGFDLQVFMHSTNWPSLACSNTSVCGQADQYSFQRWRWTKSNVSFCQMLLVISNWLIALNSATNFFIYCLAGAKFRQVTIKDKPARLRFFSWMGRRQCSLHHLLHIIVIWKERDSNILKCDIIFVLCLFVWRVSRLKSHSLCPNSKVAVTHSVTDQR